MKARNPIFIASLITISALLLVLCWKPWKPSGELTEREAIALTNAVQAVSPKPIIRIGFSDLDNRAFVQTDSITDSIGHVYEFGYTFERRLFGWKFMGKTPKDDPLEYVAKIEKQYKAKKIQAALMEGAAFPGFNEKDVADQPLSLADFKGKVVLLDFWATWCAPCRREIPNVAATFQKYHGQGFEVIGVSLDEDKQALLKFTKENQMTWPEYFDGKSQPLENKLAAKYGIAGTGIPMDFLLDGGGKLIGKNLRGEALPHAVAKALAK